MYCHKIKWTYLYVKFYHNCKNRLLRNDQNVWKDHLCQITTFLKFKNLNLGFLRPPSSCASMRSHLISLVLYNLNHNKKNIRQVKLSKSVRFIGHTRSFFNDINIYPMSTWRWSWRETFTIRTEQITANLGFQVR